MEKTAVDEDARGGGESETHAGDGGSLAEGEGRVAVGDRERSFAVIAIAMGGGVIDDLGPQGAGDVDVDGAGAGWDKDGL